MDGVPTDSTNLVIRALELIRQKTGNTNVYFKADLVKRVPAQAGLGGGSANAATAMWGANELLGRPATLDQVRVVLSERLLHANYVQLDQRSHSFFHRDSSLNGLVNWDLISHSSSREAPPTAQDVAK